MVMAHETHSESELWQLSRRLYAASRSADRACCGDGGLKDALKSPHLRHRAASAGDQARWRFRISGEERFNVCARYLRELFCRQREAQSDIIWRWWLDGGCQCEAAISSVAFLPTRCVRAVRCVVTAGLVPCDVVLYDLVECGTRWQMVCGRIDSRRLVVTRAVCMVQMLVSRMFVHNLFSRGDSAVTLVISLTLVACVSMVRAASEDRMQQHRGHGQSADGLVEHLIHVVSVSVCAFVRIPESATGQVLRTLPHRHKPDYHLTANLTKPAVIRRKQKLD